MATGAGYTPKAAGPWSAGGITGGLLTLAGFGGALFGSGGAEPNRDDYDIDPERRASKRYDELSKPRSSYNTAAFDRFRKIAIASAPTMDTIYGYAKSQGVSGGSSNVLAGVQTKANQIRGSEEASGRFTDFMIGNEQNASRYLGLEYDRGKTQVELYDRAQARLEEDDGSFFDNLLGLGGSLLSRALIPV